MLPTGNLMLWVALLGVAFVAFNAVRTLLHSATDARTRRKCHRNHGRVISRRDRRQVVTLSAKTAKA
jgi:hypothetical protein